MAKHLVLIVEDHPVMRRGIRDILGEMPDCTICGEAADAPDAFKQILEKKPDLAIIDISLHQGNGLELVKQVRAADEHVKLLVLSMHDDEIFAERAIRAGALGYLNKSAASTKLVEAVQRVLAGKVYLSVGTADTFLRRLSAGRADEPSPVACLSDRELEVLELIGRGQTTREIAEKMALSIKTVETHREHIKAKLDLKNTAQLSRFAAIWVHDQG